jgi:hypothetical protein
VCATRHGIICHRPCRSSLYTIVHCRAAHKTRCAMRARIHRDIILRSCRPAVALLMSHQTANSSDSIWIPTRSSSGTVELLRNSLCRREYNATDRQHAINKPRRDAASAAPVCGEW